MNSYPSADVMDIQPTATTEKRQNIQHTATTEKHQVAIDEGDFNIHQHVLSGSNGLKEHSCSLCLKLKSLSSLVKMHFLLI